MPTVADNLARIRDTIASTCASCGRDPAGVNLVAVTKTREPAVLAELAAAGVADWGENRVGHLEAMAEGGDAATVARGRFHYIGRVQSRQFKRIAPLCASIHSLAEVRHVAKLERACAEAGRRLQVFCQVSTGHDAAKAGAAADELPELLAAVRGAGHLDLVGLMCMAPFVDDEATVRDCFATCRHLAEDHGLARLSMGMSNDYPWAIREGATDLRIGSVIFEGVG